MITNLAEKAANYYADKDLINNTKIEIYKYGFELLISTALSLIIIIAFSIIIGVYTKSFLFLLAFIPLRLTAGGYHAKHHWSCILGFSIMFLFVMVSLINLDPSFFQIYSLTSIMVSSILIWSFAPVEAVNKPLTSTQQEKQRFRSLLLASLNLALILLFFIFPNLPGNLLIYYASGSLYAGIFLVVAKVANRKL